LKEAQFNAKTVSANFVRNQPLPDPAFLISILIPIPMSVIRENEQLWRGTEKSKTD
jgi:hypothetical protein